MSYGYGLTTTLTQLAMVYAALGNDGVLMETLARQGNHRPQQRSRRAI